MSLKPGSEAVSVRTFTSAIQPDLHLPQSCSLKYRFHYVEKRTPERISIALPFGSAIHSLAMELFYRSLKDTAGRRKRLKAHCMEKFEAVLRQSTWKRTKASPVGLEKEHAGPGRGPRHGQVHAECLLRRHRPVRSCRRRGRAAPLGKTCTPMTVCPRSSCWWASWTCC
jgi:hypothetical protein